MLGRMFSFVTAVAVISQGQLGAQAPTNIDDLRNWQTLGLPLAAEWNVTGYGLQYHVDQVRAGHRFLPSVKVPATVDSLNNAKRVSGYLTLSADGWNFLTANDLPICLRTDNINGVFVLPAYNLPKISANIPKSPRVWTLKGTTLSDTQIVDCLGPPSIWNHEGQLWGASLLLKNLQAKHPNPAWVVFIENNEGPYDTTPRYRDKTTGEWLPASTLQTLSLRMRDRVAELKTSDPDTKPPEFQAEYNTRRGGQYHAFYAGFESQLSDSWQGKAITSAYRGLDTAYQGKPGDNFGNTIYCPALLSYDAGSQPLYAVGNTLSDFTSLDQVQVLNLIPAWEDARVRNPKSYRELSLSINQKAILAGALAGRHEVMTPARYQGWVQWLLWTLRDPGAPMLLRRFSGASQHPTTPLFTTADYATLDAHQASELKSATDETYLQAIIASVDRVCTDATLRSFWLGGQAVVVPGLGHPMKQTNPTNVYPHATDPDYRWRFLECSTNPPRAQWKVVSGEINEKIKVWAVATRLGDKALIYAWSPCTLSGNITVTVPDLGTFSIAAPQPWGYWVVKANSAPTRLTLP